MIIEHWLLRIWSSSCTSRATALIESYYYDSMILRLYLYRAHCWFVSYTVYMFRLQDPLRRPFPVICYLMASNIIAAGTKYFDRIADALVRQAAQQQSYSTIIVARQYRQRRKPKAVQTDSTVVVEGSSSDTMSGVASSLACCERILLPRLISHENIFIKRTEACPTTVVRRGTAVSSNSGVRGRGRVPYPRGLFSTER